MKILSILTLLFGFTQCNSSKFVETPPFKVKKAFYNYWSGGQAGVSGVKIEIHLENASEIDFDSIYFQKKKTKVEVLQKGNNTDLIGHFSTSKSIKRDLILDSDSKKEMQNSLPSLKKFPFELKEDEAILSFKKGKKTVYFKVENVKEVQPAFFPSANKK